MKVVAITGVRQAEWLDRPDPAVADNYALVRIMAAPMCTEWHAYRDGRATDRLGHEAAGEVIEVGPACRLVPGTRVVVMPQDACGKCDLCVAGNYIRCQTPRDPYAVCGCSTGRATFGERCIQQDWLLLPVPEDIDTVHASLACCALGPAFGATRRMNVGPGDKLLVSGLGPVGLGATVCGVVAGARVIGIDANPYRARLALELGSEAVVDPTTGDALDRIYALTGGLGVDKSIEASSHEEAPAFVLRATRIGGQMTSIGWGGPVNMRDIVARGVDVFGQWHWNHVRDADAMFELIRRAGPLLDKFVSHRIPMDEAPVAFDIQLAGQCGKIVLTHG